MALETFHFSKGLISENILPQKIPKKFSPLETSQHSNDLISDIIH